VWLDVYFHISYREGVHFPEQGGRRRNPGLFPAFADAKTC
jgi:hypothetical protein